MDAQIKTIKTWLGAGSINIFGLPFAGKDTQGRKLADLLGGQLLGGGEILRNSVIPERAKLALNAGELIPTADFIEIVLPFLSQSEFTSKPLILSSVGRWHGEEAGVLEATAESDHPIKAVIFLNASEETIYKRHSLSQKSGGRGARTDDGQLATRLEEFKSKTMPVLDFYRAQGLLLEIDANRPPEKITADILARLVTLI